MTDRGDRQATMLWVLGVIAFVAALWVGSSFPPSGDDSKDYQYMARMVAAGNGITLSDHAPYAPSARRPPVYPLFLAAIFATVGESYVAVLCAQALIFAVVVVLVVELAALYFDRTVAVVAGVLTATNLTMARWAGAWLSEMLYLALVTATVYLLVRALRTPTPARFAAAGAMWGLATLCKPLTLLLLPLIGLCVLLERQPIARRLAAIVILAVSGALVVGVWSARNYLVLERLIVFQPRGLGVQFWLTTIDKEDQPLGIWPDLVDRWPKKYPEMRVWQDATPSDIDAQQKSDQLLVRAGLARIRAHPLQYAADRLKLVPRLWVHSGRLWGQDVSFGAAIAERRFGIVAVKGLQTVLFSLLPLALAVVGIVSLRTRWRPLLPLLIVPVLLLGAHVPLWIEERYGMPAVPFFLIFAAWTLCSGWRLLAADEIHEQPPEKQMRLSEGG